MAQIIASESSNSPHASTSRHRLPVSDRKQSSESLKRLRIVRNGIQSAPSHQSDPLIERLDEHENVDIWLNDTINTRRGHKDAISSALQLSTDNGASSGWTDLASLEAQLSSLSSTLSFARQDTMTEIDSTISTVKTTIPRLGLELRLMRDAALTLKYNIDELREKALSGSDRPNGAKIDSSSAGSTASAALERLSALSTLHSRMTSARDVLSLAESWSTLEADVSSYLNDAKYSKASTRLAEAKTSLNVFERTPEYESRKKLLQVLCNSLVSCITPSLETSIKNKDLSESQRIASILSGIGRAEDFTEQWRKIRTSPWLLQWKNAQSSKDIVAEEASEIAFAQQLQILLDSFVVLLDEERLYAPILFPQNTRKSMVSFASTTLHELDPSLKSRLNESIQQSDQGAVLILVRLHSVVKNSVKAVSRILDRVEDSSDFSAALSPARLTTESIHQLSPGYSPLNEGKQLGYPTLSPVSPSATRSHQVSHSRKISSRRLSVSHPTPKARASSGSDFFNEAASKQMATDTLLSLLPEPSEWERALLEPLIELQLGYIDMERRFLTTQREIEATAMEAALTLALNDVRASTLLGSQIGKMLREDFRIAKSLAEDATARNLSLTFGLASDGLVSCIDQVFVTGLSNFKKKLELGSIRAIEASRQQASGKIEGALEGNQVTPSSSSSSSVEDNQWKAFEESVGLLSSLHQCEQIIEDVESSIADQLKDVADVVLTGTSTLIRDALQRVCWQDTSQGASTSKAPLAILIRHYIDRLQSGSLVDTFEVILALSKERRSGSTVRRQFMLNEARLSLSHQLKAVQQHLADMTLAPLMSYMEVYTKLPIWEALRLPGSVNEYDLAMPTFSLSPTEEMSRIGEGLLDLPRLLEVWSDNADLRWGLQGLPHVSAAVHDQNGSVNSSSSPILVSFSPQSSNKRTSLHVSATSPTLDRRSSSHRHSTSLAAIATVPPNTSPSSALGNNEDDNESVLQTYLSSIALVLLSNLTSLVLPSIANLSVAGSSQLVADLEYLLNILSALNVNTSAIAAISSIGNSSSSSSPSNESQQAIHLIRTLEAWKDSCKLKDADGKRIANHLRSGQLARRVPITGVAGFEDDEERISSLAGTPAFMSVARMRGW